MKDSENPISITSTNKDWNEQLTRLGNITPDKKNTVYWPDGYTLKKMNQARQDLFEQQKTKFSEESIQSVIVELISLKNLPPKTEEIVLRISKVYQKSPQRVTKEIYDYQNTGYFYRTNNAIKQQLSEGRIDNTNISNVNDVACFILSRIRTIENESLNENNKSIKFEQNMIKYNFVIARFLQVGNELDEYPKLSITEKTNIRKVKSSFNVSNLSYNQRTVEFIFERLDSFYNNLNPQLKNLLRLFRQNPNLETYPFKKENSPVTEKINNITICAWIAKHLVDSGLKN